MDIDRDLLLLLLDLLVLSKVLLELCLSHLENVALTHLALVDLHQVLDDIELIIHRNAVVHDFLLLQTELIQLIERLLDCNYGRVLVHLASRDRLRDHLREVSSRLRQESKTISVSLKFSLDLLEGRRGCLHLDLILSHTLLVWLVALLRRGPVESGSMLVA